MTIEAEQFIEGQAFPAGVCSCSRGYIFLPEGHEKTHPFPPHVHTLEGTMRVGNGDYIVHGIKGERYPVRADIFLETYEPVDE